MNRIVLLAAVAVLSACNREAEAPAPADTANVEAPAADANAATAAPAVMSLHGTSWEFTREGKSLVESIDEKGNYITQQADGTHEDHGTYVSKDGKACFDSAMDQEGELCWSVPDGETAVGATTSATSDKGETLVVKRVEYRPMTM